MPNPIDYGSLVKFLMNPVQNVGDVVPFGRKSLEPGMGLTEGARAYSGGANPVASFPAKQSSIPPEVQSAYHGYLRGDVSAAQVQKLVKERGWYIDLRGRTGPPEIFDPSGKSHDLDY